MTQSEKTKAFIRHVESLENAGLVRNREEIVKRLKWSKPSMSLVMNGKRNVPNHIYSKFAEVYEPKEIKHEGAIYEMILQSQAITRVVLRGLAEILSKQRNESTTKTLGDLEAAVRAERQLVSGTL